MQIINPNAAGIDVGSRSHFAAIGQNSDDVKEFGVYNEDHQALIAWFTENGVKTIAMESTGAYWQSLFAALQNADFQVILCNGKFTKNIKGKKSDEYSGQTEPLNPRQTELMYRIANGYKSFTPLAC
jgi:transposase